MRGGLLNLGKVCLCMPVLLLFVSFSYGADLQFMHAGKFISAWYDVYAEESHSADDNSYFVTRWSVIASAGKGVVNIPLNDTMHYDFTIDWGDGTIEPFSGKGKTCMHEYTIADSLATKDYQIRIKANSDDGFPCIYFSATYGVGNGANRNQLAEVTQWGAIKWKTMYQAFANCKNMDVTASDVPDLRQVTNMQETFLGCSVLKGTSKFGSWDVSNVENMKGLFRGDFHFNQDISKWNTSKVRQMGLMFKGVESFDQNLASWNIDSLKDATQLFFGTTMSTSNYDALLISWAEQWEKLLEVNPTRKGVNFHGGAAMYCEGEAARAYLNSKGWGWFGPPIIDGGKDEREQCKISEQDYFITTWRVRKGGTVTIPTVAGESYDFTIYWGDGTSDVFKGTNKSCSHTYKNTEDDTLTIKIIGNIDGDGDSRNESGFPRILSESTRESPNRQLLSVEQWGCTKWTSMYKAFYACVNVNVRALDVPDLSLLGSMEGMFAFCHNLLGNDLFKNWDVSNVENMRELFREAQLFNIPIGTWNVGSVTDMSSMFRYANVFDQDIGAWNVSRVAVMDSMFLDAHAFTNGGQSLRWTYDDDSNTSTAEVSATGTVRSMRAMFEWAFKFNQDISSWDVGSVTDMSSMFKSAYAFDQDIGKWNVSEVRDMSHMFSGSDFGDGLDMYNMIFNNGGQPLSWTYDDDNNSTTAEVSATGAVADMSEMFYRDTAFDQDIGDWDISSLGSAARMFDWVKLSIVNYDSLLIGWNRQVEAGTAKGNVPFSGGYSLYCVGADARSNLIDSGWGDGDMSVNADTDIKDGGSAAPKSTFTLGSDTAIHAGDIVTLRLSGSELGVRYTLYDTLTHTPQGVVVDGTGEALIFTVSPTQSIAYYVVAANVDGEAEGGCREIANSNIVGVTVCTTHRVPDIIMELCLVDNNYDINIISYIPYRALNNVEVWDASGVKIANPKVFPVSKLEKNTATVFTYHYEKTGFCVGSEHGKIYVNGLTDGGYANFSNKKIIVCASSLKDEGYKLNPMIPYISKSGTWNESEPEVKGTTVSAAPYFKNDENDGWVFDAKGYWSAVIGDNPDVNKVSVRVEYRAGADDMCAGADGTADLTFILTRD
ncbi:MAG: BspA family leucine-rich repeat surface protein [Bacteroidales bacterium]